MSDAEAVASSPTFVPMPELARLAQMTHEEQQRFLTDVVSRFQTVVQLFDNFEHEWPTQTDEMCRWCMHKFTWFPVGIPVRFDEVRHKMVLTGFFCSFACALAFKQDNHTSHYRESCQWLAWLARRAFGIDRIRRAPPRELLNKMTIDAFRAASGEMSYDSTIPAFKAQLSLLQRDQEIVVARKLVNLDEEACTVSEHENAMHLARCSQGGGKRKRVTSSSSSSAASSEGAGTTTSIAGVPYSGSEPPLMPAQWVRTMREQEQKKREKSGVLNMLGATKKTTAAAAAAAASSK
jgi:hypothetical protein